MKMAHSRLWLLLLLFCILAPPLRAQLCQDKIKHLQWNEVKKLKTADSFFDVKLCTEGLKWICFVPFECHTTSNEHRLFQSNDITEMEKCHAVLAIQHQTDNKWRVIMQASNVMDGSSLQFIGNCKTQFECKPDNTNGATGKSGEAGRSGFLIDEDEWYGFYNITQRKLMCELTIASLSGEKFPMMVAEAGDFSGMSVPYNGFSYESLDLSKNMYRETTKKGKEGCKIEMTFRNPTQDGKIDFPGEDFKRVNQDEKEFHCPPDYDMRWMPKSTNDWETHKWESTTGIRCEPSKEGITIHRGEGIWDELHGDKYVECVRKRCKYCPSCPNKAKCPTVINSDYTNYTACAQLKCTGENEFIEIGGQYHTEATCTDNSRWEINGVEVPNLTCRAKYTCPDALTAIKFQDHDMFNVEKKHEEVVCREPDARMSYTLEDQEVQLVAVVCNTADGQWYETGNGTAGETVTQPYKNGTLECTVPKKTAAPAKGAFLMYAGIGLAAIAVIIAIILLICCCISRNKKKKNRVSAIKHQLANKDSKSRDSKTVSKGTTSKGTTSKGSSDRSVTGARGKKRKSGDDKEDGPAIPDDGEPKKPEPRSKPASGSSITATSELQKLQQQEEERKKAAAAAALLETSKVEDKEEPQTDTPIDSAVVGKDTHDLEQPDKTPFSPNKPLQKRRLKRATIIESDEPPPRPNEVAPAVQPAPGSEPPTPSEQTPAPAPVSVMAKTQAGGADEEDEKEQPMWHNQPPPAPAPAPDVTQIELLRSHAAPVPAAAAAPASDPQQDEMKTSREKERDAAAESAARKKKIADMPTGKKKESAKKVKSNKLTTPKAEHKEPKKARSSFLKPADLVSDKSSSKKGGKSKKATKRAGDEPSKKMDATQHQHVHGSEVGCGPLCSPMPRSHTDPDEDA